MNRKCGQTVTETAKKEKETLIKTRCRIIDQTPGKDDKNTISVDCENVSHQSKAAVIEVEPAGRASLVYGCMETRLMGQYNRE